MVFFHSLRIDHIGPHPNLELDALRSGVQVIECERGTELRLLREFIRATLFGFDRTASKRGSEHDGNRPGGTICADTLLGRVTIGRQDDGSPSGRLTLENRHGKIRAREQFDEILAGVTPGLVEHLFAVDFAQRPRIEDLVREADRCGLTSSQNGAPLRLRELQERRRGIDQEIEALFSALPAWDELHARRQELERKIDELESRGGGVSDSTDRQRLMAEQKNLEQQRDGLRRELHEIEKHVRDHYVGPTSHTATGTHGDAAVSELQELEGRIDRWRGVLREIAARKQQLLGASEDSTALALSQGDPRAALRDVERRLRALEQELDWRQSARECFCHHLANEFRQSLSEILASAYGLCDEMTRWEATADGQQQHHELVQLARCETELQGVVRDLLQQRKKLSRSDLARHRRQWCRCEGHANQERARATETNALRSETVTGSNAAPANQCELNRLEQRRAALRESIAELDVRLAELLGRIAANGHSSPERINDQLEKARHRLGAVEAQLRHAEYRRHLERERTEVTAEMRGLEHQHLTQRTWRLASRYLRRLSDAQLKSVEADAQRNVWVRDDSGRRLSWHRLSENGRDQVYLALCLAAAKVLRRRGVEMPLVLLNPFPFVEQHQISHAARTLIQCVGHRLQVLVLTENEPLQEAFRLLRVTVRPLRRNAGTDAHHPPVTSAAAAADTSDSSYRCADRHWDAEEFPGELTDRVRFGTERNSDDTEPLSAANNLTLDSPIEDAPSMDPANAVRFRKIGVWQVRDLLDLVPEDGEARLHYAGITAAMIRNWQAQARLVYYVPHLRAYDARVLVACGITDPDELEAMDPNRLRRIVRRFAATRRGKSVVHSGSDYEQTRLHHWLRQSARDGRRSGDDVPLNDAVRRSSRRSAKNDSPEDADESQPTPSRSSRRARERRERRRSTRPQQDSPRDDVPPQPAESRAAKEDKKNRKRDVLSIKDSAEQGDSRFFLNADDAVVDAPSIGPKTAESLNSIGIATVADLLAADPHTVAEQLGQKRITARKVTQWQQQTTLASRVPQLRGHDAQILVALDITDPDELAASDPETLWAKVEPFVATKAGKRIIRNGKEPDLAEVQSWIRCAAAARNLKAA